jgi:hypothetical protein
LEIYSCRCADATAASAGASFNLALPWPMGET